MDISGHSPCIIQDDENGCYIFDHLGFVMSIDQMEYIGRRLLETARGTSQEEIEEYNKKVNDRLYEAYGGDHKKEKKPRAHAYVYMFECGGRYKVGVSRDISRRISELDRRPFPVAVIAVSKATPNAYEIEQYIHDKLAHLRINGEWYEISPEGVERVKKYIEGI